MAKVCSSSEAFLHKVSSSNGAFLHKVSSSNGAFLHKVKSKEIETLKLNYKIIHDAIHKQFFISNFACKIIDTKTFQRLRDIAQLGFCQYVWSTANHNRFSHSLGTYYTTGVMLEHIIKNSKKEHLDKCISQIEELRETVGVSNPELNDRVCELIKIAGLCHDLGHCAFSHAFDEVIDDLKSPLSRHEYRSCVLFDKIVDEQKIPFTNGERKFIKKLIDPPPDAKGFVYEVVSNPKNGIDTDKFDYIERDCDSINQDFGFNWELLCNNVSVIDDTVCYLSQFGNCIHAMFNARYQLHRQMYNHPKVLAIELMFKDMIKLLGKSVDFKKYVLDTQKDGVLRLTDSRIVHMIQDTQPTNDENKELIKLYERFVERNLYKHIGTLIQRINPTESLKQKKLQVKDICRLSEGKIHKDDIIIFETKLGYISGNKSNPLSNTYLYHGKDPNKKFKLRIKDIASLTDGAYQENNVFYFCRRPEVVNEFQKIFNNFEEQLDLEGL